MGVIFHGKRVAWPEPFPQNPFARSLRRRGRLIDPVKENPNTKMLKKYTKYVATAFAVASLSTFMIGCTAEEDDGDDTGTPEEDTGDEGTNSLADPTEGGGDGN